MSLDKYLYKQSISIVFLGDFNPVIIQPFWLSSKKLIREEEADTANIGLIHNEIVKFELDWIAIEVTKNRCIFKSNKSPYFDIAKDLSVSIFKILKETPIRSMGINHKYDLSLPDKNTYYEFGNKLCPLSNWSDVLNDPRLMQLEIYEKDRKDELEGQYRVLITPASEQNISFGVTVTVNDHFDLKEGQKGINLEIIKALETNWIQSNLRAKEVVKHILKVTNS